MTFLSRSFWNPAVAVDLGTAFTRVACGTLPVFESLSVAAGRHALHGGVVVDRDAAVTVVRPLIQATKKLGILRPLAIACIPTDANDLERDSVIDCITEAGANSVYLVPEPLAAALGAGVDISSPHAHLVVDIGEGITDCAIVKDGRIAASCTVRIGCRALRDFLRESILTRWTLTVPPEEAEHILRRICVAGPNAKGDVMTIFGIDRHGLVTTQFIPIAPLRESIQMAVNSIVGSVVSFLRDVPHKWGCEIIEKGLLLSGGGSLLPGMCEHIAAETRLKVFRADDPLGAVVCGAREMLPIAEALRLWH